MTTKSFDCVKMKEECQRAVAQDYAGLTVEERSERMRADILTDPILGPFYARLTKEKNLKVAETQAKYGTGTTGDLRPETGDLRPET